MPRGGAGVGRGFTPDYCSHKSRHARAWHLSGKVTKICIYMVLGIMYLMLMIVYSIDQALNSALNKRFPHGAIRDHPLKSCVGPSRQPRPLDVQSRAALGFSDPLALDLLLHDPFCFAHRSLWLFLHRCLSTTKSVLL